MGQGIVTERRKEEELVETVCRGPKKIFGPGVYAVAVAVLAEGSNCGEVAVILAVGSDPGEVLRLARAKIRRSKIRWNLVLCALPTGGYLRVSTTENRWCRHGDGNDPLNFFADGDLASRIRDVASVLGGEISEVVGNLPNDLLVNLE